MRYNETMAEDKQHTLAAVHEHWKQACPCPLRDSATQPVPGVGTADAQLVFIGEAPGKNEDEQGEPFVGRAGNLLREFLASISLQRADVYITNVVKFRPPDNRDPLPNEIRDCLPWLIDELHVIAPDLIIPLGRHALERFFAEAKISQVHGKILTRNLRYPHDTWLTSGETKYLPTTHFFPLYHPAAALYNGSMKEVLAADFKKIPAALTHIKRTQ